MIGVLALQGDFEAHAQALRRGGRETLLVRNTADIEHAKELVLPGGESSTQLLLIERMGLAPALNAFHASGKPIFATCAGLILAATDVRNPRQPSFGWIDVTVARNGWGRQIVSGVQKSDSGRDLLLIRAPRITRVGTNARMDEIRAAIGRIQLRKVLGANARRAEVVRWYREGVKARASELAGLAIPFSGDQYGEGSHHLFVVLLPTGSDRERVMTSLRESGVQTSIHYPPTHRFTAYASTPSGAVELPRTDAAFERLLTLPLGPSMTRAQVDLVLDALARALG